MTEEGRAINSTSVNTSTNYNYEYTLTDHLGNNRVTFDMVSGKVSENDYYPFGLNAPRQTNSINNYLYNKKELQNELTEYDYGFRFYDPVIGRWNAIDPFAEKYSGISPYNYVTDNPVKRVDPDGRDVIFDVTRNKNGKITGVNVKATVFITGDGASEKRAASLTKAASKEFKSGKTDGVDVSFNVTYQYSKDKQEGDLKNGENLLTFSSQPEHDIDKDKSKIRRSEVTSGKDNNGNRSGGANVGTIYSSGESDYTILHETGHFLGLDDQYVDNEPDNLSGMNPNWQPSTSAIGYEHDLMGVNGQFGLNQSYYQSILNEASFLLPFTSSDSFFTTPNINGNTATQIPFSGFVNQNNSVGP